MLLPAAVVNQNRSRDHGSRSYAVILLDDRLHMVRRQHLERGALRGPRDGVRVFPHVERAVGSLLPPVVANRLSNSENVRFREGSVKGRAPVSAGAEAD